MSLSNINYLKRPNMPDLAYVCNSPEEKGKHLPLVMFLSGFRSDMEGTKALYLEEQCSARGQGFIRFDYSGHGMSEGLFEKGTIGIWKNDARAIFDEIIKRKALLVGSSMGGWISLLLAQERKDLVSGIIGIAAAPDFTRDIKTGMTATQKKEMEKHGYIAVPNDYSDESYIFTKALIDDGEEHCFLNKEANKLSCPLRLIQGMKDTDVPWQTAFRLKNSIPEGDTEIFLVEEGDHRLSRPEDLALIDTQVRLLSGLK